MRRRNGKGRKLEWRARVKFKGAGVELGGFEQYEDAVVAERKFRTAHGIRELRRRGHGTEMGNNASAER